MSAQQLVRPPLAKQLIKIGTSGIVLPRAKRDFPPEYKSGSRLHFYGALFNTLEINTSFYKIPQPKTFAKWKDDVPDGFTFTVKLWRGITHAKNLDFVQSDIDIFMEAANQLGEKSGCILIQFPASIIFSHREKVATILQRLNELNPSGRWSLAIEVRHASWYQPDAYALFERYNTALVFHDMPGSKTPRDYVAKNHVYCRFHGPTGNYVGSYAIEFIQRIAEDIKMWNAQNKIVYAYFNNTMEGALENA